VPPIYQITNAGSKVRSHMLCLKFKLNWSIRLGIVCCVYTSFCVYLDFGSEWKRVYDSVSPHEAELPGNWNKLKGLDR